MGFYLGAPMLWFILVRVLFVLAVTYAAMLTRPFSVRPERQPRCWRDAWRCHHLD